MEGRLGTSERSELQSIKCPTHQDAEDEVDMQVDEVDMQVDMQVDERGNAAQAA